MNAVPEKKDADVLHKARIELAIKEVHVVWAAGATNLTASPDSRRVGYRAERGDQWFVVVDGQEGKAYDEVAERPFVFSPDSKHVAYRAKRDDKWFVVVDGQECKAYDQVAECPFVFSPDSKRAAYRAKRGNKWFFVVDSQEGDAYDEIAEYPIDFGFSLDSERVAYKAKRGDKWFVVVDGQEGEAYDEIRHVEFSPDSKRLAYAAKHGDKWFVVVDGQEDKAYDEIGDIVFSPDSKHMALWAKRGDKWFAVMDGREGKAYYSYWYGRTLVFSPDSNRFAYVVNVKERGDPKIVVVDGQEGNAYWMCTSLVFSADSKRVAYAAKPDEERCFVVVDGQQGKACSWGIGLGTITFSPDSKRLAYWALGVHKCSVMVDGQEGKAYDGFGAGPSFSPDNKHVAYWAERDNKWFVVVDGQESKAYEDYPRDSELVWDAPDSLHGLAKRGDEFILVEVKVEATKPSPAPAQNSPAAQSKSSATPTRQVMEAVAAPKPAILADDRALALFDEYKKLGVSDEDHTKGIAILSEILGILDLNATRLHPGVVFYQRAMRYKFLENFEAALKDLDQALAFRRQGDQTHEFYCHKEIEEIRQSKSRVEIKSSGGEKAAKFQEMEALGKTAGYTQGPDGDAAFQKLFEDLSNSDPDVRLNASRILAGPVATLKRLAAIYQHCLQSKPRRTHWAGRVLGRKLARGRIELISSQTPKDFYNLDFSVLPCSCAYCGFMNLGIAAPPRGIEVPYYHQDNDNGAYAIPVICDKCSREFFVVWDSDPRTDEFDLRKGEEDAFSGSVSFDVEQTVDELLGYSRQFEFTSWVLEDGSTCEHCSHNSGPPVIRTLQDGILVCPSCGRRSVLADYDDECRHKTIVQIGERLHKAGGVPAMQRVANCFVERGGSSSALSMAWNGVGGWMH